MNLKIAALSIAMVTAIGGPALAEVVVKGRVIPDNEVPYVEAQCATLKAREWGNSNIEDDPDPNEDIVASGNAHRVRSIDLYMLSYHDCRRAGLI